MLNIHLFGNQRVLQNEATLKFSAPPKATPLWAYLLLHRRQPVPRTTLAYTLWPDDSEDEARKNLRRHVYQLQRALPKTGTTDAAFTYDAAGNRKTLTDSATTTWTLDDLYRPTQIAAVFGSVGYTYDRLGLRQSLTYPDSKSVNYAYR